MARILFVFGTRPEAIKMAPLVIAAQRRGIDFKVCVTGQHREMLSIALDTFDVIPDYNLNVMEGEPCLTEIYGKILHTITHVYDDVSPDYVLVHGDTATTFAAALAAHLKKIDVVHIEAGLRSHSLYSPWPEEANRRLVSCITRFHFCPTERAKLNLVRESIDPKAIHVVGNTVIDALQLAKNMIDTTPALKSQFERQFDFLNPSKKLILVTGHRRENFGEGLDNICHALRRIAEKEDVQIVYPVHLNPKVKGPVSALLGDKPNIFLVEPVEYLAFVYLMDCSYLVLTDSGGIQEEAPSLGKPVLVMRDTTERPEAIESGVAVLTGANADTITMEAEKLFDPENYARMAKKANPFGDGKTSERILDVLCG